MRLDPDLLTFTKFKFKWIKGLNITSDILNITKEKMWNALELIDTDKYFLKRTKLSQALRSTVNKQNLMKLRSFFNA